MNVINKLTQWASIRVIGAIGGGFYAWGESQHRLSQLKTKILLLTKLWI